MIFAASQQQQPRTASPPPQIAATATAAAAAEPPPTTTTSSSSLFQQRKAFLEAALAGLRLPDWFALPTDATIVSSGLVIGRSKSMDSLQAPLRLAFRNAGGGEAQLMIFKTGDDLRQDILTLRMLRIMNRLWLAASLDLHLSLYTVVCTGRDAGMIEVVPHAETTAYIQKRAGGIAGAFKDKPLANWLREHNPRDEDYAVAVENFTRSCAGYCVATYILGIADRHNDNVMLSKTGHLFHIDFGHFLGNFMKWKGIKRERAPFVLTPEYVFVMGGKGSAQFERFCDFCITAFVVARRGANELLTLMSMMLSTGLRELSSEDDLAYMRDALLLELSEDDVRVAFRQIIFDCLGTLTTRINNAVHIFAHP